MNIPTCDGGILASELIDGNIQKKYSVGIIPHIKEQNEPEFEELHKSFDNSIIIDLLDDPLDVVKIISSCDYVISSSLHGLIVADSFHIPNIHVKVTNNMLGDGFKFDDYYSEYGIKHNQFYANEIVSTDFIQNNYQLKDDEIERKKIEMKNAFPYK